jgi:hypothetical protein
MLTSQDVAYYGVREFVSEVTAHAGNGSPGPWLPAHDRRADRTRINRWNTVFGRRHDLVDDTHRTFAADALGQYDQFGIQITCGRGFSANLPQAADANGNGRIAQCGTALLERRIWAIPVAVLGWLILTALLAT